VTEHQERAAILILPAVTAAAAESGAIARVASTIASRIAGGGRLFTFGAGHSWAVAAELCSRAGGLPMVIAMNLDDLRDEPRPSHLQLADSMPERVSANGPALLARHGVGTGDALLIISQSGRNGASVEMARQARRGGTYVASIVSLAHCRAFASRHPEGLKLPDVADDVIDNHCPPGDAAIPMRSGIRVAATSTVSGALIAQLLNVAIVAELDRQGARPDTISSANVDRAE
jgi:uncharacterized phosphosugar-binding protein